MAFRDRIEPLQKAFPVFVIPSRQDCHEFVSAHPINRAVFEGLTDQPAGGADEFISGLVAVGIIDIFQTVHVADHDGKGISLSLLDGGVQFTLFIQVCMFALDPRHGVGVDDLLALLRALVHERIIRQHDHQCKDEHPGGHQNGPGIGSLQLVHLGLDELLIVEPGLRNRGRIHVVIPDIVEHQIIGSDHGLPHPDQCHE